MRERQACVLGGRAARDQRRPLVEQPVVERACLDVPSPAGNDRLAREPRERDRRANCASVLAMPRSSAHANGFASGTGLTLLTVSRRSPSCPQSRSPPPSEVVPALTTDSHRRRRQREP
jgi:hypothetical protein